MSAAALASPATSFADLDGPLTLESGAALPRVRVAYRTWGRLAPDGANAVLVCHALTGSADVDTWWPGLLGPGRALDPDGDFVICSNILGSCYGTTGPTSAGPAGRPWGADFPAISVRDMVGVQARLLDALGVTYLKLVVGGSLGGMQALEWAAGHPSRVGAVAAIAVSGRHSPWCIGLSAAQRAAIRADARFRGGRYPLDDPPADGLAAARAIAMCTYRSPASFGRRFGRTVAAGGGEFEVERYLRHQGGKLVARFDANAFIALTRAMDTHDLARGRGGYEEALRRIDTPTLVVSIDTDVLYPPDEQRELADLLPNAELVTLRSPHGHDAFLIEVARLDAIVRSFRRRVPSRSGARQGRGGAA